MTGVAPEVAGQLAADRAPTRLVSGRPAVFKGGTMEAYKARYFRDPQRGGARSRGEAI